MAQRGAEINYRKYNEDPPCKACKVRKFRCHSSCESYNAWKADNERIREMLRSRNVAEADVRAFLYSKPQRSPGYYSDKYRFKNGDKDGT